MDGRQRERRAVRRLMDSDWKLLSLRDFRCLFPRGEAQKDLGTPESDLR